MIWQENFIMNLYSQVKCQDEIALHLFPKRIREKVLYRLKRFFARIRKEFKTKNHQKAHA